MVQTTTRAGGAFGRFGKLGPLATIVLVIAAALGFAEINKVLFAPWAVTWLPGPKLVGSWRGPLHARQGAEYHVYLDLDIAAAGRSLRTDSNSLAGTARICAPGGQTYQYAVSGGVRLFTSVAELHLTFVDPKQSGLDFDLRGTWDADALYVTASKNPFDPDGIYRHGSPRSTADPDDSFERVTLQHATLADFERACRQLPPVR
ncbi:MAG: hypothetical protein AB7P40_29800 [Chloroflexota bacterium]